MTWRLPLLVVCASWDNPLHRCSLDEDSGSYRSGWLLIMDAASISLLLPKEIYFNID